MILAHIPAGYLLTRLLQKRLKTTRFLWVGLLGSTFPDFDILYHLYVDSEPVFHRHYWVHLPVFWLGVSILAALACRLWKSPAFLQIAVFFIAGNWLHLFLDTFNAPLYAFKPFSDSPFLLRHLPGMDWLWAQIPYFSDLCELPILLAAGVLCMRERPWRIIDRYLTRLSGRNLPPKLRNV